MNEQANEQTPEQTPKRYQDITVLEWDEQGTDDYRNDFFVKYYAFGDPRAGVRMEANYGHLNRCKLYRVLEYTECSYKKLIYVGPFDNCEAEALRHINAFGYVLYFARLLREDLTEERIEK